MRSDLIKEGPGRAPHRSLLRALGIDDLEMKRPFVAVVNSKSDYIPGHMHLDKIAEQVKAGIRNAGGVPFEFNTIGVCDGIAMNHKGMKYSLCSRELIADSIEVMLTAHPLDAIVFIPNCDKIVPGMVGVDIGCGMETVELREREVDFEKLDALIRREIPYGREVRDIPHALNAEIDLTHLRCTDQVNLNRAMRSIGSLGGGNHFIEVDRAEDGRLFLVVHSGSRHLGTEVAEHYQNEGRRALWGGAQYQVQAAIDQLKAEGPQAILPQISLSKLLSGNQYVTIAIPIAIVCAVVIWVVLSKTLFGYELKATGNNPNAAKYCGMAEKRNIILTLAIGGALAGLGASLLYQTGYEQWQCTYSSVPSMGFNGIAAAFLGGLNPIGSIFASFFIQHITAGGAYVDKSLYCSQISDLISAIIIYLCSFVLFFKTVLSSWIARHEEKKARKAAQAAGKGGEQA